MNGSSIDRSLPVSATKPSITWLDVIRGVTFTLILSLGSFYILMGLFGILMNGPFEPPEGVSTQEHFRRMDSGYYVFQGLWMIAKMAAYLAFVALPHRWILRSRVRFIVVMTVLCGAFSFHAFELISAFVSSFGNKTELHNRVSWWPVYLFIMLFYAAAPASLYLSWRYGRKVA